MIDKRLETAQRETPDLHVLIGQTRTALRQQAEENERWARLVDVDTKRIDELEAETAKLGVTNLAYNNKLRSKIDTLTAQNKAYSDTVNEICKLTAPGGFPRFNHLHTITLRVKDEIAAIGGS
jgi:hypothetical protein